MNGISSRKLQRKTDRGYFGGTDTARRRIGKRGGVRRSVARYFPIRKSLQEDRTTSPILGGSRKPLKPGGKEGTSKLLLEEVRVEPKSSADCRKIK